PAPTSTPFPYTTLFRSSRDVSFLGEPARIITADRHPHIELVVEALDASPEVHTPQLVFAGDITQRLEGNRDFDGPAVAGDDALGDRKSTRLNSSHDQIS